MLNCRDLTSLVSRSMDENLPLRTRLEVRLHLAICRRCREFRRQMKLLREWLDRMRSEEEMLPAETRLSPAARERIAQRLSREG